MSTTTGTVVRLHGKLGEAMGRAEWNFMIERPREAVSALNANTGGRFRRFIAQQGKATEYTILVNGKAVPTVMRGGRPDIEAVPPELHASGQLETIDIIPVPAGGGGGGGLWQIIAGVVLIIVGVVFAFIPGTQGLAPYTIMAGLSLLAGGIAASLSPTPQLGINSSVNKRDGDEEQKTKVSYLFNGVQNTTAQGGPVPILYGRLICGSQMVSIGIHGGSMKGATIGGLKPPPEDSAFYDDPLWEILHLQPRAALVATHKTVRQMDKQTIAETWQEFDLPEEYPASWPEKKKRGRAIPTDVKRKHLYALSYMFNHNLDEIEIGEARNLYRFLELDTIPDPSGTSDGFGFKRAGWKLVVEHVGLYYQANP